MKYSFKDSFLVKKPAEVIETTIVLILIMMVLYVMSLPSYKKGGKSLTSSQRCFTTIRILENAIEYYEKNNKAKIEELNDNNINKLIKEKYIRKKEDVLPPTEKCKYSLNKENEIACEFHGSIKSPQINSEEPPETQSIEEIKEKETKIKITNIIQIMAFLIPCVYFLSTIFFNKKQLDTFGICIFAVILLAGLIFYILRESRTTRTQNPDGSVTTTIEGSILGF